MVNSIDHEQREFYLQMQVRVRVVSPHYRLMVSSALLLTMN